MPADPPDTNPEWLTPIDHTADAGFVVTAPDLKTLFERAALGMFGILADPEAVSVRETMEMTVSGGDLQDLMLNWLNQLNFLHVIEEKLFCRFDILKICETELSSTLGGERIDPDRHTVHTEIKAVTFHGMRIEESEDGWSAEIIFDL